MVALGRHELEGDGSLVVAYPRTADQFSCSRAEVEDERRTGSSKLAGFGVLHDAVAIFNGRHSTRAAAGYFAVFGPLLAWRRCF